MPIFEVEILDYYMCIFNLELVMCMYVCTYKFALKQKKRKEEKVTLLNHVKLYLKTITTKKKQL